MGNNAFLRLYLAGFVTALLVTGCGGSPSDNSSDASGGKTPRSSVPAAPDPASLPRLQKIVLQAGDLPPGWEGKPYKVDPGRAAGQKALMKCMGTRDSDQDKVAEAHSQDFGYGSADISSSAASYRVQSAPDSDAAMLKSAKFSPCYEKTLRKQLATSLPPGAKIESASFKVTPGRGDGPSNVLARGAGTVKVSLNGQRVAVYLTAAYIAGPLFEAEVDTTNVGQPVTPSLVKRLVASVAARAASG